MFACLNPSLTGGMGLREWVAFAKKTGWDGVEVSMEEVASIIAKEGESAARAVFEDSGIRPGVFGMTVNWREDDATFEESVQTLPRLAEAAAAIGCYRTATWVLPTVKNEAAAVYAERMGKRFQRIAQILKPYNIAFGLEFIGPHHFLKEGELFARTMQQMLDFEREMVGEPNMGLLVDSYHWFTTDGTVEQLSALKPEQIVHVHINDAKPLPIEELHDGDRLLHGEGVIDLVGFLTGLKQAGYDGPVAPEPLGRNLAQELGAEGAAVKAKQMLDQLFAKAGVK